MIFKNRNGVDITLPEGVSGIDLNESLIFGRGNNIDAGCEYTGGKVIMLTVDKTNQIIKLECDAKQESNKCSNPCTDSDICLINIKTT